MTDTPVHKSWLEALSVYRQPRVLAMLFLGFSAGLPLLLVFGTLSGWLAREVKACIPNNERVIAGPHVAGGMTMPSEVIVMEIKRGLGMEVEAMSARG